MPARGAGRRTGMYRAIAVGDIRRWMEGLDDSEEVSADVMFPEPGGSCRGSWRC